MLFNTFEFWAFFVVVVALLRVLPAGSRNHVLLAASYVFYAAWDPRFLGLLWLSTVVDFVVARRMPKAPSKGARRRLLWVSLATNLGVLGFFKYADFFAPSLVALLDPLGVRLAPWALEVVLPVGISFYTFQTLSYTIDVYRGQLEPTQRIVDFALYVAFFPQLVAGPIERGTRFLPQVQGSHRAGIDEMSSGAWLCLWGLFKKCVIGDNLAALVDGVYGAPELSTGPEVLVATYAFALQIYCDFSGYTHIARGTARILGFDLMRNFDRPYFSRGLREFWHRWHISLSTWLRDYLYIPLGGNRGGELATYRNVFVTMLLGGVWHGGNWTFLLWGAFHGALLGLERAVGFVPVGRTAADGLAQRARGALQTVGTFHVVVLGWLIFRAESVGHLGVLLSRFADPSLGDSFAWLPGLVALGLPLFAFEWWQGRRHCDDEFPLRWPLPARALCYAATILGLLLLGEDGAAPFIYFQF